ncbi:hypothetical protein ACHAXA_008257 [Cyclostephanos tholiformis]|uniref:CDC20/Fizzy WD40 domain-containing protein n=1 Tax=Cyclostephanos tholiformis TaxID=382380 RepID=A0ABD3RD85_9STRA
MADQRPEETAALWRRNNGITRVDRVPDDNDVDDDEGDTDAGPEERGMGGAGGGSAVSNKLLTETIAPFRGLRLFFYAAFASGAFVGGLITLSGVFAASNGLRPDIVDLDAEYVNLVIDFGAVTAFGVLAKFDLDGAADAEVEEKVRRKGELKKLARDMREREAKMRDLNVSVRMSMDGETRVAPLSVVQENARQHAILVVGPGRAIRDALRGAQLNKANFAMTNILVVPYETGVDVVDRMTRPDGKGGFGADTRPSYETQPYVAEPVGDGWEDFANAEMNAAVEQAGEGVRDEGIALVDANDGRVPWRQMVDDLEEAVTGEKKKETSDGVKSMVSCGCRQRGIAAPVPRDVRGGRGGSRTRRIDGAGCTAAKNGAVEVGRWKGRYQHRGGERPSKDPDCPSCMKRTDEDHRQRPNQRRGQRRQHDEGGGGRGGDDYYYGDVGQRETKRPRVTFSLQVQEQWQEQEQEQEQERGGSPQLASSSMSSFSGGPVIMADQNMQTQEPRPVPHSPATGDRNRRPDPILRMMTSSSRSSPSSSSLSSFANAASLANTVTPSSSRSTTNRRHNHNHHQAIIPPPIASRFTFDFVDDIPGGGDEGRARRRQRSPSNSYGGDASLSSSRSSTPNDNGSNKIGRGGGTSIVATALSPTRLDARYSRRLPPIYCSPRGSTMGGGGGGGGGSGSGSGRADVDIKRNLFGTGVLSSPNNKNKTNNNNNNGSGNHLHGGCDDGDSIMMMDDLSGGICAMDVSSLSEPQPTRRRGSGHASTTPMSSPGGRSSRTQSTSSSPASHRTPRSHLRLECSDVSTPHHASVISPPSTFLSSPPARNRGLITGVTSPLSGNLGRDAAAVRATYSSSTPSRSSYPRSPYSVASAASTVGSAASMSHSSHSDDCGGRGGGNHDDENHTTITTATTAMTTTTTTSMVDYERHSGAGDRFIPSRALSNLNFTLPTGIPTASSLPASPGARGGRGGNIVGGGGVVGGVVVDGSAAGDVDVRDSLNPAQSFGATMIGGATVADEATAEGVGGDGSRLGRGGDARGQDAIASTSSEDVASTDGAGVDRHDATNRQPILYDALLRSELLGENIDPASMHPRQSPGGGLGGGGGGNVDGGWRMINASRNNAPFRERSNNLRFNPTRQFHHISMYGINGDNDRGNGGRDSSIVNSFHLSPLSISPNQRITLGSYKERCKRKIAKVPTKVLDAPALQDDFYLNLVDWSSLNVLAVGLGSSVYLWSATTSRVTQLCDLSPTEDVVTSVAWSEGGRHLAVGSTRGDVQLWDAQSQKLVRTMTGHSARVGALSWKLSGSSGCGGWAGHGSSSLLASGSRDRIIHLRDPRSDAPYEMKLCGHKQEVCGLRWSFDERSMLASGGNDNKLLIWDVKKHTSPMHVFADHTAAVKAIAWSPHQNGLLASGGGTADRCIRFWNCLTGHGINSIDTGSQVCNLAFSKNCNELVSTHGYSLNQIGECVKSFSRWY